MTIESYSGVERGVQEDGVKSLKNAIFVAKQIKKVKVVRKSDPFLLDLHIR